jgi:DNA-binding phage protein
MMQTAPFDAARYFSTAESQEELLTDALANGDAEYVALARGIARRQNPPPPTQTIPPSTPKQTPLEK